MTGGFAQVGAQLSGVAQQQTDLQRAVAAGELWMEAGVADRAVRRCEQAINEIDEWLTSTDRLVRRRKFGANEDGRSAAERFGQAGQDVVDVMRTAQRVFANMAATYRAAGRTVADADSAGEQMFRGPS